MSAVTSLRRLALIIGLVCALSWASAGAAPAMAASPYLIPMPAGSHVGITQGNYDGDHDPKYSGQFAWDFVLYHSAADFPVVAARGGKVIGLRSDSSIHCGGMGEAPGESCWTEANYVLVDHGDGTSALYMHLAQGSVQVSVGKTVAQGQVLGRAGSTGWSTGIHLHFQVEATPSPARVKAAAAGWWWMPTVSVTFSDPSVLERNPNGIPTVSGSTAGGYVSANGGSAGQGPTAAPPGGVWISPDDGSQQVMTIHAAAHAYPSKAGQPAIDHVNFTVWWPALGTKSGPWKTACTVRPPKSGDEYACDFDPLDLGAPAGQLSVSFDVYDTAGGSSLSPNGERTVQWTPPDAVVADGWQTYQGDGYVVDYPGAALYEKIPDSQTYGLYSGGVSYYAVGSDTNPQAVYLVEHISFSSYLNASSLDYTTFLKDMLSLYSMSSSNLAITQHDITVDGKSGLYFSMEGGGSAAESEVVAVGNNLYLVMAAHQTGDSTLDSQRFFQSFHLR